jgi:hypothetical protein
MGMPQRTISEVSAEIVELQIPLKLGVFREIEDEKERLDAITAANRKGAEHVTDFKASLYNVWKQQTKTEGSSHAGNTASHVIDFDPPLYPEYTH